MRVGWGGPDGVLDGEADPTFQGLAGAMCHLHTTACGLMPVLWPCLLWRVPRVPHTYTIPHTRARTGRAGTTCIHT